MSGVFLTGLIMTGLNILIVGLIVAGICLIASYGKSNQSKENIIRNRASYAKEYESVLKNGFSYEGGKVVAAYYNDKLREI